MGGGGGGVDTGFADDAGKGGRPRALPSDALPASDSVRGVGSALGVAARLPRADAPGPLGGRYILAGCSATGSLELPFGWQFEGGLESDLPCKTVSQGVNLGVVKGS